MIVLTISREARMPHIPARLLGLAAGAALFATQAQAETVLTLSSYSSATSWSATVVLNHWMETVEELSDGEMKIRFLKKSPAGPAAQYDLARDGIVDVSFGVLAYTPGRFEVSSVGGLPGLAAKGEALSLAMWRGHEEFPAIQKEFGDVEVLSLMQTSAQHLFNNVRPVKTFDDFSGLKVRVPGGLIGEAAQRLGVTAVSAPATKVYEMMSGGILDGFIFPLDTPTQWDMIPLFDYATIFPGGIGSSPIFLIMNKDKFQSLTEREQEILREASGERISRFYGRAWDERDQITIGNMEEAGVEITYLDREKNEKILSTLDSIQQVWLDQVEETRGIDGKPILDWMMHEVEEIGGTSTE